MDLTAVLLTSEGWTSRTRSNGGGDDTEGNEAIERDVTSCEEDETDSSSRAEPKEPGTPVKLGDRKLEERTR
jgi:hypothetical protein